VRCLQLAIANPPEEGSRVRVFNQMTEVQRVSELAKLVSRMTGADIDYVDSPRNEADSYDLPVENEHLLELGRDPITLEEGLLGEVLEIAKEYADRLDLDKIPCLSLWRRKR
jgi:UDP-sulfoquinovose synthase